jgi:cysteinyl-tRNA synthetase
MHNGMLQMGAEKMAKSVGNVALLHEVLETYGRDAVIMFFVNGHYRGPMAFDDDAMDQAVARVRRVREAGRRLVDGPSPPDMASYKERFFEALRDDFNTPTALAAVFEWIRQANSRSEEIGRDDLVEMLTVLALENLLEPEAVEAGDEAVAMLRAREDARAAKDFAEADRLRDELRARGWEVRDGPSGPELVPVP